MENILNNKDNQLSVDYVPNDGSEMAESRQRNNYGDLKLISRIVMQIMKGYCISMLKLSKEESSCDVMSVAC